MLEEPSNLHRVYSNIQDNLGAIGTRGNSENAKVGVIKVHLCCISEDNCFLSQNVPFISADLASVRKAIADRFSESNLRREFKESFFNSAFTSHGASPVYARGRFRWCF